MKKWSLLLLIGLSLLIISACNNDETKDSEESTGHHAHMNHEMDGGEAPKGMKAATNPTFPLDSEVIVNADHMPGMKDAEGKVTGAFDTTTYSVTYTSSEGEKVENHKWVVQEELKNAEQAYEAGDTVELLASHMEGMKGSEATIETVETETVYMIDLTTTDGKEMKNHKWVLESELSAK